MMAGPGDERAAVAAGRGHLRASHADREQMIDTLKAAFVQGRLSRDEFETRVGQTLVARTYAELAVITADLPIGRPAAQPPSRPSRRRVSHAARWGAAGLVTPAILATAFASASQHGGGEYAAVVFVIAFGYFLFWLSVGADMLWEWHATSLPGARMCVRCSHTAASHRTPQSCTARLGSLNVGRRCSCLGYVPPGVSPKIADLRLLPTHCP